MPSSPSKITLFPYTTLFRSVLEQLDDVGLLDDLAGVHHTDLVRHLGDDAQVVGDEQQAGVVALLQVLHQLEDLGLDGRSEEHTSELQSHHDLVCRLLLEKKK